MYLIANPSGRQASPILRDKFLKALDRQDQASLRATAHDLLGCRNFLPGGTCIQLGLALGSTYGDAAESIARSEDARPDAA
jgi:hypothetical protein